MTSSKTNARITGALFILGTAPGIAAAVLLLPLLDSPNTLSLMASNRITVLIAALLVMVMGFACAGVGMSLYPTLKPHGEALALSVIGFRLMEGTLQIVNAACLVVLLAVSLEFVKAGSPQDSFFQPAGGAIMMVHTWLGNGSAVIPWCIAAFVYSIVFYKTKLIPRWLSVWSLLGLVLFLLSAFASMFGILEPQSLVQGLLAAPIALQEMVLAVWLIVKGYKD